MSVASSKNETFFFSSESRKLPADYWGVKRSRRVLLCPIVQTNITLSFLSYLFLIKCLIICWLWSCSFWLYRMTMIMQKIILVFERDHSKCKKDATFTWSEFLQTWTGRDWSDSKHVEGFALVLSICSSTYCQLSSPLFGKVWLEDSPPLCNRGFVLWSTLIFRYEINLYFDFQKKKMMARP